MSRFYVIANLGGRCGNQFYQIATAIAYAKKNDFDYYVTSTASNCDNNAVYFNHFEKQDRSGQLFTELQENGIPYHIEIPKIENLMLIGYWQSFKYFDAYRQDVLDAFKLPYERKDGYVSIHVRRGDFLVPNTKFPPLEFSYYQKAIQYFSMKGYNKFVIFSDDIPYCKSLFNSFYFANQEFEFSEGKTELEDLSLMSGCEHNIIANSSFSYAASWFNQNPDKIVLTPDENNLFVGANRDMIPDTYIKIN